MRRLIRSELLKLGSTRTVGLLVAWLVAVLLLVSALHLLSLDADELGRERTQRQVLGLGTGIGALFAALVGALSITGEFRAGTIRPTLLVTPSRTKVLLAKSIACVAAGAAIGLTAEVLAAALEAGGLAARGIDVRMQVGDYVQLVTGGATLGALLAVVGLGVGAALRQQVAAVAGLCVWLLFLEPLVLGNVPSVGRYAPGASAGALSGAIQTEIADRLLAPAAGLALLVIYAALAGLAGAALLDRQDID